MKKLLAVLTAATLVLGLGFVASPMGNPPIGSPEVAGNPPIGAPALGDGVAFEVTPLGNPPIG